MIEINMSNPKPKSKTQIISELQKENEKLKKENAELKKHVLDPKPNDQDILAKRGPTGPLQTCSDKEAFEALKRAAKPPPK